MQMMDDETVAAHSADAPVAREKWLAVGAAVVLMTLVVRNAWVCEDAYLTLRTIDNWVHGFGLRWNVSERVQAYTHPLWLLLVTLPYLILRDPYAAALLTSLTVTLAAVLALVYLARSSGHAIVALMLLVLSRSFVDFSTSGLENPLSHLLLAALVWLYAVREARLLPVALCAALLTLNRPDTLLIALPPLAHSAWLSVRAHGMKQTLKQLALGLSPLLLWELFSLFYYGFLVPNTAFAKLNTGLPQRELARQGVAYLFNAIAWDPALSFVLMLGVTMGVLRRNLRSYLLVASVLLYLGYVIQIGGDFMQGRFLTVPVFLAACLVAITPLAMQDLSKVAALVLPSAALYFLPSGTDLWHADAGIADEREFYRREFSLSAYKRTGSFPSHIFRDNGERFAERAKLEPVQPGYNVGVTGFYAGPNVYIIDSNALSEPLLARLPTRYDPAWRIGHYTRDMPPGYSETVKTGSCKMPDAQLCSYNDKLRQIVAGDLWSWSRIVTIAAMNVGSYQHLIDQDRYRFPNALHERVENLSAPIPELSAWNDARARVIPADGIELALGSVVHAKQLDISFDGNDRYQIEFKRDHDSHVVTSDAEYHAGLSSRSIAVPAEAVAQGYDRLVIRALAGDGLYSLGYIRLRP
ncbi:MAG: hypothetical protein JWN04_2620 [Myxococcaceae bacterium]|nr:hypothetical protein [Myxococcaceae bacterium]